MPQDNGSEHQALPTLRVTEIGEFIRYQSCERRFKLGLNNRELGRRLPFAERRFNTLLDPVLQETESVNSICERGHPAYSGEREH